MFRTDRHITSAPLASLGAFLASLLGFYSTSHWFLFRQLKATAAIQDPTQMAENVADRLDMDWHANMVFDKQGSKGSLHLIDFGESTIVDDEASYTGLVGTIHYVGVA